MTRRRWIADEVEGKRAAVTGAHAEHLSRALRVQAGQEFEIACGDVVRRGVVSSVGGERVEFELGEEVPAQMVAPITLLLAVYKFDRMEWAIEKCTELNVAGIIPVIARRTEKHLAQAAERRVERWRRIAREASEQSRRRAAPEIGDPVKLAGALLSHADLRIVLDETERELRLTDVVEQHREGMSVSLAIGPEGGWAPDELQEFGEKGWVSASLGATILRAETAAITALAITRAGLDRSW